MSESSSERNPRERQIDALILEYEQAAEQGRPLNPQEFLKRHAEFAAELREYIENVGHFREVVQPFPSVLEETEPVSGSSPRALRPGMNVRYFGDYEILDELGHGGMGVVYKARQTKLKKIVALKMIKVGQLASEEEVRRFQGEARAAARLDHPGIVAVHEVGVDQGQHYYAMDYVAGGSLSLLYREQPVAARRAAELVKKLAEAMHYAHGQNIVHRDLKPANVLLNTSGAPRITDFGLALRIRSDGDSTGVTMTQTGQVLGTAGYMSPEQAAGKTNLVGTQSDIYSLGAILYALLTGRAPFVGDSPSVTILQVLNQEPIALRALNPSVPRDLETICLKCLEKEPHKRYGTAQLLADDLNRFLEGRPVVARPISSPARAWRWCRRNPVVATLSAAVAIVLVAGIATSTTLAIIASANADLAIKRAEVVKAQYEELKRTNGELAAAQKDAESKRKEAEQNATIAREQSQLALKSLESVIYDIQRKLDNVPGAGDLQRSLLQTVIVQLDQVSEQYTSRSLVDRHSAAALLDLGDLIVQVGSNANLGGDSQGHLQAARKAYQRAFNISQQRAVTDPNDPEIDHDLYVSHIKLGRLHLLTGQLDESRGYFQTALKFGEKIAAAKPRDAEAQLEFSAAYSWLGDVQLQAGEVTEALGTFLKGLEVGEKAAKDHPADADAQRNLSVCFGKLGDVQLRMGKVSSALVNFQQALSISRQLAPPGSRDGQAQRDVYVSSSRVGDAQFRLGKVNEALSSYQEGNSICQSMIAADPTNRLTQRDLSMSYGKLGDAQLQLGNVSEALKAYKSGFGIDQKLAMEDPHDFQTQRELSVSGNRLGDIHVRAGQWTEALGYYRQGTAITEKIAAANPGDGQAQRDLAGCLDRLGYVELALGQTTDARTHLRKAMEISRKMVTADPSDAQAQCDLSISYIKLGNVELQFGQLVDAQNYFQSSLDIGLKLVNADANDTRAQHVLIGSYEKLGTLKLQAGKEAEALAHYQKYHEICQKLVSASPNDAGAKRSLALSYTKLGGLQSQMGQLNESLGNYLKSLEIRKQLAETNPDDVRARFNLFDSYEGTAEVQLRLKMYEPASESYSGGLKLLVSLQEQKLLPPGQQGRIKMLESAIELCKLAPQAIGDWNKLLEAPAEQLPALLEIRGQLFVEDGSVDDAVQAATKLRELKSATNVHLYNAACIYSLCAATIKGGKEELNAEQVAQRQKYISDALATLREAKAAGFTDFPHMVLDPDLAPLRNLPEFQELVPTN